MKTLELKGSLRKSVGKRSTKNLRQADLIPCVLYGGDHEDENIHFYIPENRFQSLIFTSDAYLVKLDIDGEKHDAILQDVQYHPVTDSVIHADFIRVTEGKKITMRIPIRLTGTSAGLKSGGKLRQRRRYLKVRGLVKDMPEYCDIDITDVDIGNFVKISELEYDNLEILDPPRAMVIGVVSSRLIAKGLREPVAEEVEAEEPEVVEAEEGEAEGEAEGEGEGEAEGKAEGKEGKEESSQ
jgi:large subunit ribosomal protein L25